MAASILIDDTGAVWPANSAALARRFGHVDARIDLARFAVQERGAIHIRSIEEGVRVALRPGSFSHVALAGALQALNDLAPPRIMLVTRSDGDGDIEFFTSVFAFIERAEVLAAGPPIEIKVPRYSVPRSLRNLATPSFGIVRSIVDLWKDRRGEFGEEVRNAVVAAELFHRMVLVRQSPPSSRLITEHFGAGIKIYRPCETLLTVGRDLDEMPDRDYGAWGAEAYVETLRTRRLRLESVRAFVRTSAGTTLRTRYDRVLMPWRGHANDLYVMCLSIQREVPVVVPALVGTAVHASRP
jgi:hypothetical protein